MKIKAFKIPTSGVKNPETLIHHVSELKLPFFLRLLTGKHIGTVMNKKIDKDCLFYANKKK